MEKETRKTFRWGTVVPMALTAVACILMFAHSAMPRTALAASVGAFLLASGLVCAVAFFVGQPIHAARMLAGITQVSVGLWALITCTDFSRSVLALGLGVFLMFAAVSEIFEAVASRAQRATAAVRSVLAAGYVVTGILLIVNNFVSVFPSAGAAVVTAGAVMLLFCAEELYFLIRGGFFREETLVYRPVKRPPASDGSSGEN